MIFKPLPEGNSWTAWNGQRKKIPSSRHSCAALFKVLRLFRTKTCLRRQKKSSDPKGAAGSPFKISLQDSFRRRKNKPPLTSNYPYICPFSAAFFSFSFAKMATSTRRLACLPLTVLLLATGWPSPYPWVVMRFANTPWEVV